MQIQFWTLILSPQLHLSGPVVTRPQEDCEDRKEAHPGFKEKPKATPGSSLPAGVGWAVDRAFCLCPGRGQEMRNLLVKSPHASPSTILVARRIFHWGYFL